MNRNALSLRTVAVTAVTFSTLAIGTALLPAAAGSPVVSRPFNTGTYSDSVSGGPVLAATNSNAGNPFNDYGIEGKVSNDTGGVGVLGYGQQAKSYGVYGVSFGTNGIGVYGAGDGPTPAPGTTPSSVTQSTGVAGDSHSGYGVYGSTEFPNGTDVDTPANIAAGVFGADLATNVTENFGVAGASSTGYAGVAGFSGSNAVAGVLGIANSGSALQGIASTGYGADIESDENDAVYASIGNVSGTAGFYSEAPSTGYGAYLVNGQGIALRADTTSGTSIYATTAVGTALSVGGGSGYGINIGSSGGIAEQIVNSGGTGIDSKGSNFGVVARAPSNEYPIVATDGNDNDVFYVDGVGNVKYHGTLSTFARTRSGASAESFGARSSAPTIEDTGSAELVNGRAAVALDPAIVEQMDLTSRYRVLLTPDGDTNGLYVESKTTRGFIVREIHAGHGTLDFDYRIVAAVDGQAARRTMITRADAASTGMPHVAVTTFELPKAPVHRVVRQRRSARLAMMKAGLPRFYVPRANGNVEHRLR